MAKSEPDIPAELQPDPKDYAFDLERALRAVVALRATVPDEAFTASVLGTERVGSAAQFRPGLFLTIGYLITEAEQVWLTAWDGQAVPGHALAYDQETGFGLVQALGKLDAPVLDLGDSERSRVGERVVFASAGGRKRAVACRITGRQEFAGYWEYLLDDAIFTAPAHPFWGGGALIGPDGTLLGIGSLILQQGGEGGRRSDMNMVVPVEMLRPILDDLLQYGRVNRPARPWLGVYAMEDDDTLVVGGLADGGPAEKAGVQTGDRIIAVNGVPVEDLAGLWREMWSSGSAGAQVRLTLGREGREITVAVASSDRARFLKSPLLH